MWALVIAGGIVLLFICLCLVGHSLIKDYLQRNKKQPYRQARSTNLKALAKGR